MVTFYNYKDLKPKFPNVYITDSGKKLRVKIGQGTDINFRSEEKKHADY
jgi:hypothetical protein